MNAVRIKRVATDFPAHRVKQTVAAKRLGEASGDPRRVQAIARGTHIEQRAVAVPEDDIRGLGTIEQRNRLYREVAPRLALAAARKVLTAHDTSTIGQLIATSCTGYMVPGWDVQLAQELPLNPDTVRLPITQSGCAGGVVAIARARDYLLSHPGREALVVATELCSLAFHTKPDPGNLTAALIFGDGAAAAIMASGDPVENDGLEVVDTLSTLLPESAAALGFELTDGGFFPLLTRELSELLPDPTKQTVCELLGRNCLALNNVGFWLVHAGGARIISNLEKTFNLAAGEMRWSWRALQETGNTSSVSILDVMSRYLDDPSAPKGFGVALAFGPGVSIEALLLRRC